MASLNRIVLVNSWGDEMFSGNSLLSEPPMNEEVHKEETEDEEPAPDTLRSSVFLRAAEPKSRPIIVDMDDETDHRAA